MIKTYQYKHHDRFKNLYDLCRKDWEDWSQSHDIEKETVNAGEVYEANLVDYRCGWWGVPIVHFYKKTKWSAEWNRTYEATKDIPGVIHVAVNFTKPGHTIPVHVDKKDYINKQEILLIPTVFGINIPSNNVEAVGFQIAEEKIYIAQGDAVSFLPEQAHGSWNWSDEWRVTLYITTERSYWNL
jgi:hypothetical protein|tara:strand:+ start:280 stop:831 length:552 start_codon:yes stop_codon:yes gene_type:complete